MNEQIRDFLKNNKPVPATKEEVAQLMKISKKAIWIFMTFVVVLLFIWLRGGAETGMLGFIGVFLSVIAVIIFFLEIKDKIKIKRYDKIYSTYVYVESGRYGNATYKLNVCYYDFDYGMFQNCKLYVDKVDILKLRNGTGAIIRVFVGEKNSKIHYIAMKSD